MDRFPSRSPTRLRRGVCRYPLLTGIRTYSGRKIPGNPGHFETRYVSENGGIRWKKCWVNVTTTLAHEWVGLEEVGDGLWDVYFSRLRLGRLDERRMRIEDPYGRWTRWEVLPMFPDKSVTYVPD